MSFLWSPGGPQLKKPGGIFWRVVSFMHTAASMKQLTTAINTMYTNNGVITGPMKPLSSAINARMLPAGSIADTMKPLTTAVNASQIVPGSITDTMLKPLTAVQAAQIDSGTIADTIPAPPSTSIQGAQGLGMTVGGTVGAGAAPSSAINMSEYPNLYVNPVMQKLTTSLAGAESPQGQIATALALASSVINGQQAMIGTVADVMAKAQTALASLQTQSGSIAAALQQALTDLELTYTAVAQPPVFDSTGGQGVNGAPSFAHTIGAGANGLIMLISNWSTTSGNSETTLSVKVGTTPLTFLGRLWKFKQFSSFSTTYYASIYAFGLIDGSAQTGSLALPKGAQTMHVTGGNGLFAVASMAFSGVSSFDTANISGSHTAGVTTGLTQSTTADASSVVAQCFTDAASSPNGSYSAYSQTQKQNIAQGGSFQSLVAGYGTGPNPTFNATAASTSWDNGFLAVPIVGV